MKKVLIVSPSSYYLGGKANFTKLVYESLLKSKVINVHLLNTSSTNKRRGAYEYLASYKGILDGSIRRNLRVLSMILWNKIRLFNSCLSFKPSIIQLHSSSYVNFWDNSIYFNIAKLFRKKIVIRLGGGGFDHFYNNGSKLTKFVIRKILNNADHLIIQSGYWQDFLLKANIITRTSIIPNFVDCNYWQSPIAKHKLTSNEFFDILFMVGSEVKVKGYYDVMPVFEELIKDGYKYRLHLVGLGRKLEKRYEYLINKEFLIFYDHIKGKEKLSLYRSCDLFLLPTYLEGFPNTIFEAMAAGIPIITSNIPQIRAYLKEENVIFVSPGNKLELKKSIIHAYENPSEMECLVKNNIEKVSNEFDVMKIEEYFKKLYNSL